MIDFMKLRLTPIELWDLNKGQAYTVLFAKPNADDDRRPVVWFSTELVFSDSLSVWESSARNCFSYYYSSSGAAQYTQKPEEDWEKLQLFSVHEHL